jgi:hypothetical protein
VAVSPGLGELTAWFAGGRPLAEQYSLIQIPPATPASATTGALRSTVGDPATA